MPTRVHYLFQSESFKYFLVIILNNYFISSFRCFFLFVIIVIFMLHHLALTWNLLCCLLCRLSVCVCCLVMDFFFALNIPELYFVVFHFMVTYGDISESLLSSGRLIDSENTSNIDLCLKLLNSLYPAKVLNYWLLHLWSETTSMVLRNHSHLCLQSILHLLNIGI